MKRLISALEKKLSYTEILNVAHKLNKSYYAYMFDEQVWGLLYSVFPQTFEQMLDKMKSKYLGHNVVNSIIMHYYPGERPVKYYLAKKFVHNADEVTIFEMAVDNSRLDVGRINGVSYAYEIKTKLDTLNKLQKQISDYSQVFEYVTAVIDFRHLKKAKEILPEFCGIEIYNMDSEFCNFETERCAEISPLINTEMQLKTLLSKDLEYILKCNSSEKIPLKRKNRELLVRNSLDQAKINYFFKEAVKHRYYDRWDFLRKSFKKINPIDIQELYVGPINPESIYYKNSSIV